MRYAKESKQFGAQRQASEQAAAEAGLSHLAQLAGYSDTTRLGWAMEARIGGQNAALGQTWNIGDYEVTLTLPVIEPKLVFKRGDRTLSAAPEAVRQSETYGEIEEAVAAMREQTSHFAATFEDMMANEESLSRDDLRSVLAVPAARTLLERLILRNEHRRDGLARPRRRCLAGAGWSPCTARR